MSYYTEYTDVVADTHKVPGYRGSFAENFGRFIPCRGGGTATTYYMDLHDVDEDLMSISVYGGRWAEVYTGITHRHLADSPTNTFDTVASRLIYLS